MRLKLLSKPTDAELVRKVLANEVEAFEALVLRYQKRASAVAQAAGARVLVLEDIVQEAFLRSFQGLRQLRDPDAFQIYRDGARRPPFPRPVGISSWRRI